MVCSPEQLAANRRNSKKSTGPRTTEGKAASRRNGLKHGLTGLGVVILDEDAAVVQERFEAFEADLKPANAVATFLARQAALLSIRIERSAREEAARVTLDMLEAEEVEAEARFEEVDHLFSEILKEPARSIRKLKRSAEGIDRLLEAWRQARRHLDDFSNGDWSIETVQRLTGQDPGSFVCSRILALTQAARGNFAKLGASDWPELEPPKRREAARSELLGLVDGELLQLEAARQGLDFEKIAQGRAGAAARAIFDPSKAATLARKYEAAAHRGFYRALETIEAINAAAEAESDADTDEIPVPVETSDEMASSFPARDRGMKRMPKRRESASVESEVAARRTPLPESGSPSRTLTSSAGR